MQTCCVCVHAQVFELSRHLKQSGLDNKENVPWDGGMANPAVLEVIGHLVHEIHIITHEAHRMEGVYLPCAFASAALLVHVPLNCIELRTVPAYTWLIVSIVLKTRRKLHAISALIRMSLGMGSGELGSGEWGSSRPENSSRRSLYI